MWNNDGYDQIRDGMRVIVEVCDGRLRLLSRNENDVTVSFPELTGLAEVVGGHDIVLDGEIVAFTGAGCSSPSSSRTATGRCPRGTTPGRCSSPRPRRRGSRGS